MSYITKVSKRYNNINTDEIALPYPIGFNKNEKNIDAFDVVESLVGYINAMEYSLSAIITLIQKDEIEDAIDGILALNECIQNYKNQAFDEADMDYPVNELDEDVIEDDDYE